MIEEWDFRELFYHFYGMPGYGRIRSIMCFIAAVTISMISFFIGSIWGHNFIQKVIRGFIVRFWLSLVTVKRLKCTRARHTLSQRKKSRLNTRRVFGYLLIFLYTGTTIQIWANYASMAGYTECNLINQQEYVKWVELIIDWLIFVVMDLPVFVIIKSIKYFVWYNPCYHNKGTVDLSEYKQIVIHNRKIELSLLDNQEETTSKSHETISVPIECQTDDVNNQDISQLEGH